MTHCMNQRLAFYHSDSNFFRKKIQFNRSAARNNFLNQPYNLIYQFHMEPYLHHLHNLIFLYLAYMQMHVVNACSVNDMFTQHI